VCSLGHLRQYCKPSTLQMMSSLSLPFTIAFPLHAVAEGQSSVRHGNDGLTLDSSNVGLLLSICENRTRKFNGLQSLEGFKGDHLIAKV
jgi:hypothetical protein